MTELALNTLSPAPGSKPPKRRKGRGIGSGRGHTCGRGNKGQKSRTGGKVPAGFEGGQMPIARRLPKFGFRSRKSLTHEKIRVCELNRVEGDVVDLISLRAAGIIGHKVLTVKVYLAGELKKAVNLKGITVSAGARKAIEALGGKVED